MDKLVIETMSCDVWLPYKTIEGVCECYVDGSELFLKVNEDEVPVIVMGVQFSALVPLNEGKNTITAYCIRPDGQELVSNTIECVLCLEDRPRARISVCQIGDELAIDGYESEESEISGAPIVEFTWSQRDTNPEPLQFEGTGQLVAASTPKTDGEYYITLEVKDQNGSTDRACTYFRVVNGDVEFVEWEIENAQWIEDAIVYGVVPHNFGKQGFKAITAKLDYLKDLGINTIWLAPSNDTPNPTGHSYNVRDYFELRADYGTKDDFRELVNEAHQRGLRVMMDFVPNHTAIEHRYMVHTQEHGPKSPYWDFYERDVEGNPTHYFFWDNLPNLNFDNPEVFRWITEAMLYWVREFDIDGYRVDVAWGPKQRRPDFWPQMRAELQRIKPDICMLAEASARDPYYFVNGFDAAYDWTEELGHWSMEKAFEVPEEVTQRVHNSLTNHGWGFPEDALVFRFINNNDTFARFNTRYGLGMTKAAAALVLTGPGLPLVYTGEEVGAEYEPYSTDEPISFDDLHGLRDYYRRLIALRSNTPSLRSRLWEPIKVEPTHKLYAYVRFQAGGAEPVLVVINFSNDEVKTALDIDLDLTSELLSEESVQVIDGKLMVKMAPWGVKVFA